MEQSQVRKSLRVRKSCGTNSFSLTNESSKKAKHVEVKEENKNEFSPSFDDFKHESLPAQPTELKFESKNENFEPGSKLSLFEQMRLKNIAENEKFLQEIDLNARSSVLGPPPKPKVQVRKSVPSKPKMKIEYSDEPRRKSERLQNIKVNPVYIESDLAKIVSSYYEPKVPKIEPHVYYGNLGTLGNETNREQLKKCLSETANGKICEKPKCLNVEETLLKMSKLKIRETDVAKCCQGRIYDAKFHPGNKLLLATGDKYGNLGFWDIDADEIGGKSSGCYLRQPHQMPIRCLKFSHSDWSKLFTCSYDGTLKCVDLNNCEFTTVCREENVNYPPNGNKYSRFGNGMHWFDFFFDGNSVVVGEELGHVVVVDARASETPATAFVNGMKPVKCVSAHPTKPYILASDYNTVKIWDMRNTKQKFVDDLYHGKVANGAFFSPVTGDKILTTCSDDYLRVFDSSVLSTDSIKTIRTVKHDNHTGRWLAPFQAIWHPRNEDVFLIGSMDYARKLEVFTTTGSTGSSPALEMVGNDSICCRNDMHPMFDIVAGTTSSGKAFIWR